MLIDDLQRDLAIAGLEDLEASVMQRVDNCQSDQRVILDHQHLVHETSLIVAEQTQIRG